MKCIICGVELKNFSETPVMFFEGGRVIICRKESCRKKYVEMRRAVRKNEENKKSKKSKKKSV